MRPWRNSSKCPSTPRAFSEAHAKIKPVEAATEGIYLTGLCHYPKPVQESVAEALACASRATTVLSKDFLLMESIISTPWTPIATAAPSVWTPARFRPSPSWNT